MSTTSPSGIERTLRGCRPADVDPVVIDASDLDSTAPDHLRELKRGLAALSERADREGVELVRVDGDADAAA